MIAVLFLGLVCEYDAHSLFRLSREQPAKMLIDALDGGDGIATQVEEIQVANALTRESIAFLQKGIQRL
jgi:hypothetical protein